MTLRLPASQTLRLLSVLCVFIVCFSSCVSLNNEALQNEPINSKATKPPFAALGPGAKSKETIHFLVKAYSNEVAEKYSLLCERHYRRIMGDIGMYSFVPSRPYNIIIYKDSEEYIFKTKQPEWSGGITYGNAILVYEDDYASSILAHEMTHLIFNEFMGLSSGPQLIWLNEGLAVYEEMRSSPKAQNIYDNRFSRFVARNPIGFIQMMSMSPLDDKNIIVEKWYAQVGNLIGFMISEGGSMSFYVFLKSIKEGYSLNDAIKKAFTGHWENIRELEKSWLISIRR
jgi:Peptidase MA superfamily